MVFLACFPYVRTCMSIKLVIFETNQMHVGGALADGQEINKSSFEIFVFILLTSNHMIFLVQFGINEHFTILKDHKLHSPCGLVQFC